MGSRLKLSPHLKIISLVTYNTKLVFLSLLGSNMKNELLNYIFFYLWIGLKANNERITTWVMEKIKIFSEKSVTIVSSLILNLKIIVREIQK